MIICICGMFPVYDRYGHKTGKMEFTVSHGIDFQTGKHVILPGEHPAILGAKFSRTLGEWVLLEKDEKLEDYFDCDVR